MIRILRFTSNGANALFWIFGLGLSLYLAGTATGLIRMTSSSEYYSTFMFGVISMVRIHHAA